MKHVKAHAEKAPTNAAIIVESIENITIKILFEIYNLKLFCNNQLKNIIIFIKFIKITYFNDTNHSFNLNASLEPFLIKKSKIKERSF